MNHTVKSRVTNGMIKSMLDKGQDITTSGSSSGPELRFAAQLYAGIIAELSIRISRLIDNAKEADDNKAMGEARRASEQCPKCEDLRKANKELLSQLAEIREADNEG